MNKPARQESLEEMTNEQLKLKRSDIVQCDLSAKTEDARQWYKLQLLVLDRIVASRQELLINFSENDTTKWAPTFDEWAE